MNGLNIRRNKQAFIQDITEFVNEIGKRLHNIGRTEVNDYWNTNEDGIIDIRRKT